MNQQSAGIRCDQWFNTILGAINAGTGRHKKSRAYKNLSREVAAFSLKCDCDLAELLDISLHHYFDRSPVPTTVARCDALIDRSNQPLAVFFALALRASLSVVTETLEDNGQWRARALEIAEQLGRSDLVLRTATNWTFLALQKENITVARHKLGRARTALNDLRREKGAEFPLVLEMEGRLLAHEAKAVILDTRQSSGDRRTPDEAKQAVNELYERAYRISEEVDHRRTNLQIEWADELIKLQKASRLWCVDSACRALELATTSLDTHVCDQCLAYYHQVKAYCAAAEAEWIEETGPAQALELWATARREAVASLDLYSKKEHPYVRIVEPMLQDYQLQEMRLSRPDQVFLSHKGTDKSLVRRFSSALGTLGYKVWLDEKSMSAGVVLHRGLLDGMKASAAAIFFITPDFADEGFLAKEIEYALQQEIDRPGEFKIVPIVFRDAEGRTGIVPELLRSYVYKHPPGELEALEEIVRAIPLTLPPPRWA